MKILNLYKTLGLDPLDKSLIYLKQALIHDSYNSDASKNNSRLVFSGMFAFRGDVADLLMGYLPGRGQELQHVLGNLLKNEKLEKLFHAWNLEQYIKVKEVNFEKLKHIFVFAILGYIHSCQDKTFVNQFILKYIITEKDIDDLWREKFKFSMRNQLEYFVAKRYNARIHLSEVTNGDKTTTVVLKINNKTIKTHTSKSVTYARNKVIKDALKEILNDALYETERMKAVRKEAELKKLREERLEKHKRILASHQSKKEERIHRKNEKSILALQKTEKIRKMAMLKKQKRIERERILLEKSRMPMSGKKQRFLQDKLK